MSKWLNFGDKVINSEHIYYVEFVRSEYMGLKKAPAIKIFLNGGISFTASYDNLKEAEEAYDEIVSYLVGEEDE